MLFACEVELSMSNFVGYRSTVVGLVIAWGWIGGSSLSLLCAQDAADATKSQMAITQGPPDVKGGQFMEWEGWTFRWQFRDIEGLMLTDVHFRGRKVLKSINLAEIYVPYATGWPRPEDFALGGFKANPMPLLIGRDCNAPNGGCRAFNRDGTVASGKHADVMLHEESTGFLYAGTRGRAAGKMLVLWSMAHFPGPFDGYTYVIRWKLRSDGAICADVGATGGLQHLNVGEGTNKGIVVGNDEDGNEIFAPSHIHNFYFRIDFDIDGAEGNVAEEFSYELDGDDPTKATAVWRPFEFERGRVLSENVFRSWRVKNPNSVNAQGHPRSYHLLPGGHGAWKDGLPNPVLKGDFFITKFHPKEFPYTLEDRTRMLEALTKYLDNAEPVLGADVVAWYRLSFAHHPRSEDWMDQPIVWHGFEIIPRDFLDQSPLQATP